MISPIELDKSKCVKCGLCVKDCAFKALRQDAEGNPTLPKPEKCMHCQHCFAICPKGAIKFEGKDPENSVKVAGLALPKAEEVENWLKTRRSIREYRDADVDKATLEKVLTTLGNVPTGCNARGLTFTCFSTRESMNKFRGDFIHAIEQHREGTKLLPRWLAVPAIKMRNGAGDMFFRGAPGMLIVSSDELNPAVTTPKEDLIATLTYFEMLANANGIATCWCGFLELVQKEVPELLEKTIGLNRKTPFYAMLFGLPAVKYQRGVQRETDAKIVWK